MTVVSALITKHCTAHASDAFLTILKADGNREVVEDQKPQVVPVKHWRGALTYWGLAQFGQWSTLDWLLFPRFEELFAALAEMMNTFEQWKGLEAYDPLKKVVRDVLEDCGITMQQTPSGSLYIWVNEGKLPL